MSPSTSKRCAASGSDPRAASRSSVLLSAVVSRPEPLGASRELGGVEAGEGRGGEITDEDVVPERCQTLSAPCQRVEP